jgi:hypothetical protein
MQHYDTWKEPHNTQRKAICLIPETLATVYNLLPLSFRDGELRIGVVDDECHSYRNAVRDLGALLDLPKPILAFHVSQQEISAGLKTLYTDSDDEQTMFDIVDRVEKRYKQ